jgi:hypothetical protein
MPFNGSGLFQRIVASFSGPTLWRDQATAQAAGSDLGPINPDYFDIADQDMADGLTNCITKDGQTIPTANLPMGGYRHTNVGNPTAPNQYAVVGQVQGNTYSYAGIMAGGPGAYTLTLTPAPTAYTVGMVIGFKCNTSNIGACTVNVNSLGVVPIRSWQDGGTELGSNDLLEGGTYEIIYVGPSFGFQIYNNADRLPNIRFFGGTAGGTANALDIATRPVMTGAYQDGTIVGFRAAANNTAFTSIKLNGTFPVALNRWDTGGNTIGGELVAGRTYEAVYHLAATAFVLFNSGKADAPIYYAGVSGGSANALTLTTTLPITAYVDGLRVAFKAANTNTGTTTVNLNGISVIPIRAWDHHAIELRAQEIRSGGWYEIIFDAANGVFHLFNDLGAAQAVSFAPATIHCTNGAGISGVTNHYARYKRLPGNIMEVWVAFTGTITVTNCYEILVDLPYITASIGTDMIGVAQYFDTPNNRWLSATAAIPQNSNIMRISNGRLGGLAAFPIGWDQWVAGSAYTVIAHIRYEMP